MRLTHLNAELIVGDKNIGEIDNHAQDEYEVLPLRKSYNAGC